MTAPTNKLDGAMMTDEQWYDLAQRHASANWNDFGYMDAVKALCADYFALLSASKPAAPVDIAQLALDWVETAKKALRTAPSAADGYYNGYHDALAASPAAPAQSGEPVAQQSVAYRCPDCAGAGVYAKASVLPEPPDVTCTHCNGRGTLYAATQPSQTAQSGETCKCRRLGDWDGSTHHPLCDKAPAQSAVVLDDERAAAEWALFVLIPCGHHEWAQRHRKVFNATLARAASPQATATQPAQTERALTDLTGKRLPSCKEIQSLRDHGHGEEAAYWEERKAALTAAQPANGVDHAD
jgi:hypothetical protein